MPKQPHETLLNRELPLKAMAEHYKPQLYLLTELAKYTSSLIPSAFQHSGKQLRDVIVCFTLLKQVGVMLDAVELLARSGAITAAYLPARAAFEASLFLEWILVADGERKAVHYYVGQVREERLWGKRVIWGTRESSAFVEKMKQLGEDLFSERDDIEAEGTKVIAEADRILAQPQLAAANAAFDAYTTSRGRKLSEPEWYQVLGKPTVRSIAEELKRLPDYVLYYSKGSEVAHASPMQGHVQLKGKGAVAHPIRNPEGADRLLKFASNNALHTFMRVLQVYQSDELPRFGAKYVREWRSAFLNIPKIKVEPIAQS
jgi:Family of unknown function (DUF5677)